MNEPPKARLTNQTKPFENGVHVGCSHTAMSVTSAVKKICGDVFGIHHIGDGSDLFDLGIDSIHIIQINSRLQQKFGISLTFAEIFDNSTIAALSNEIFRRIPPTNHTD